MQKNFEIIDVGFSLNNVKLLIYAFIGYENNTSYKSDFVNQLILTLETQDKKKIEFVFYNFYGIRDRGGGGATEFCINTIPNEFFKEIIDKNYKKSPEKNLYKLYTFLDKDYEPVIEIISPYYEIRKIG
jgi:hypothetical protein